MRPMFFHISTNFEMTEKKSLPIKNLILLPIYDLGYKKSKMKISKLKNPEYWKN